MFDKLWELMIIVIELFFIELVNSLEYVIFFIIIGVS